MGSAFYPNLNKTPHHFSVLACVYSDFWEIIQWHDDD
jgi:hypothetical protein